MSEDNLFSVSGPHYLTCIDWGNSFHRRSIAASLVQGAYLLEDDRRNKLEGPEQVAPPWWEFFNFSLKQVLIDDNDLSYFGAIFEYKSAFDPSFYGNHSPGQRPPQYVVAFRGTVLNEGEWEQDLKLDLHVIFNDLQNSRRFHSAIEIATETVDKAGQDNVWLVGHSLGSSIALIVGRDIAKTTGIHLETYLFNPPFISPPVCRIKNEALQFGLRFANSVVTAGLAAVTKSKGIDTEFTLLSTWVPYLFLNPLDYICCEYIGYFKHRKKMEAFGAGDIGHLATQHSIGGIVSHCEAIHLIPSAYLTVNTCPSATFRAAHGLCQWWKQDLELHYNLYHYV